MQESHCYAADRQTSRPAAATTDYSDRVHKQLKIFKHYCTQGCAVVVPAPGQPSRGVDYTDTVNFAAHEGYVPAAAALRANLDNTMTRFLERVQMHRCKVRLDYKSALQSVETRDESPHLIRQGSVSIEGLGIDAARVEGFGLFGPPALDLSMGEYMTRMRMTRVESGWYYSLALEFDGVVFLPLAK
jgi:hypothetical protein